MPGWPIGLSHGHMMAKGPTAKGGPIAKAGGVDQ